MLVLYFVLMLTTRGGNSAPLAVYTYQQDCEFARKALPSETFCLVVAGPKDADK